MLEGMQRCYQGEILWSVNVLLESPARVQGTYFMKTSRWIPPSLLGGGSGLAEGERPVALSSKVL